MNDKELRRKRLLCILKSVSGDPDAFASFLRYLSPEDAEEAWQVVFELAQAEQPKLNDCADLLGLWCTRHMLNRIRNKDIDLC